MITLRRGMLEGGTEASGTGNSCALSVVNGTAESIIIPA